MLIRPVRLSATLLFLVVWLGMSQQTRTPLGFWRDLVRKPLSGPNAGEEFLNTYQGAQLPNSATPYLEGAVVSVVQTTSRGRKLLLSMESNDTADAALLFDGRDWKLKTEPQKGTLVRFIGVARDFTKEPFLITFDPQRVEGIDVETTESNPPFRSR